MLVHAYERFLAVLGRLAWLPPLLARVLIGYAFFMNGKAKLENLEGVTSFFADLGIPAPGLNAFVASLTECAGGLLVMLGLGTRLATIPLCVVMIVATLTGEWPKVTDLASFAGLITVAYFAIFFWLLAAGPGPVSLDRVVASRVLARKA